MHKRNFFVRDHINLLDSAKLGKVRPQALLGTVRIRVANEDASSSILVLEGLHEVPSHGTGFAPAHTEVDTVHAKPIYGVVVKRARCSGIHEREEGTGLLWQQFELLNHASANSVEKILVRQVIRHASKVDDSLPIV